MVTDKPRITRIEAYGIIISSIATVGAFIVGYLASEFNKEKLFSDNLSTAIDYLSQENVTGRRMAVLSLTNSAQTDEQLKELLKAIIIVASAEKKSETNLYTTLLTIATLDPDKEEKMKKLLDTDKDIESLLKLFPPYIAQLVNAADKILNPSNKTQYLDPIKKRISL